MAPVAAQPLIQFNHVSKHFELNRQQERTVFDLLKKLFGRRRRQEFFWPLQDVSFAIGRGLTVGVIGGKRLGQEHPA